MSTPLFWPSVFYDLFPFGDAVYNLQRPTHMPFREWSSHTISREELEYGGIPGAINPSLPYGPKNQTRDFRAQPGPSRWQLGREFLRTLYCLGKRIDGTYAAKTHIAGRNFGSRVNTICKLRVGDLIDTLLLIGKEGSVRKALNRPDVPFVERTCLETLSVSTANVVGKDGRRVR